MKKISDIQSTDECTFFIDELTVAERDAARIRGLIAVSIQQQRLALGLTQRQLADMLGVSQAMVSRWENGEDNYTVATLAKIASALGLQLCNPVLV